MVSNSHCIACIGPQFVDNAMHVKLALYVTVKVSLIHGNDDDAMGPDIR